MASEASSTILAPRATTFSHYHTLFSETFTLLTGSITVGTSPDMTADSFQAKVLRISESVTVKPGQLHNFPVGDGDTRNGVTFEPGSLDFERGTLIMRGTQEDGISQEHGSPTEENTIYMAVMGELLNARAVRDVKTMSDGLYATKGKKIQVKNKELVAKYTSAETLYRAVQIHCWLPCLYLVLQFV